MTNLAVAVSISFIALVLVIAIMLPDRSYSGRYTSDILVFFDGAHRILSGQVPNRDFHTPLGPLTYLLTAFGLWLRGTVGGMMPATTAVFIVLLTPILIYACTSRLRPLYALGFATYLLLLVAAPLNPGDPAIQVSFAMYYNRLGWAALSLLILFLLPREPRLATAALDAAAMASLLLFMFYIKISYAAVGVAFVGALLLLPPSRRAAVVALVAFLAAALVVELLWKGTASYFSDIRVAAEASGAVRGSVFTIPRIMLDNLAAGLLFLAILAIALWRGAGFPTVLLCLAMGGAGVLLVNQNAQETGILTLIPAGIAAALAPPRRGDEPERRNGEAAIASGFLVIALALPVAASSTVALGYYLAKSVGASSADPYEASIGGLVAREGEEQVIDPRMRQRRAFYRDGSGDIETLNVFRHANLRQPLGQSEYLQTLADGVALLRRQPELSGKLFVFDMANPFPGLLGREPARGVDAWNHAGRTMNSTVYRAPGPMFADVDVIMVPKAPVDLGTTELLQRTYGSYLRGHFDLAATSDYWLAYVRKPAFRRAVAKSPSTSGTFSA